MKIAILLTGEYRTFDVCRKTMEFLDDPRTDIYFSTWDRTIYTRKKVGLACEEIVTADRIKATLNKEAVIEIQPWDLISEGRYNTKFIHRLIRGLSLIWETSKKYDYIMVLRPDIFFDEKCDYPHYSKYKYNMGFAWLKPTQQGILDDPLFISSYDKMKIFYDALLKNDWNTSEIQDWHKWWFVFTHSISPSLINVNEVNNFVFCRKWASIESSYSDIIEIGDDWRDLSLLERGDDEGEKWVLQLPPNLLSYYNNATLRWVNNEYSKYAQN